MKIVTLTSSRLKELRIKRNLSQSHMATVLNYDSDKGYRNVENGESEIKLSKLELACDALEVPVHEFLNFNKTIDDILMEEYIAKKSPPPHTNKLVVA